MSAGYVAVQWSRHKRIYDVSIAIGIAAYLAVFFGVSRVLWRGDRGISDEVILIRSLGSCAIVLLHIILCIGPLARLDPRFLPILYNRRHLGVITFLVALAHATVAVGYYHGFGVLNPIRSLLISNTNFASLRAFPFEILGLLALAIMFLMAATSHDFWLRNLSAFTWKRLHMLVYLAYGLLVGHVALGALQSDRGWAGPTLMLGGLCLVSGLHLAAALKENRKDRGEKTIPPTTESGDWLDVGAPRDIPIDRARTVCAPGGERIAIFHTAGSIAAVTNVCAHQGGPIGEGKVIDGCVTCPWHGWQYRPQDGRSPPPFKEKIATYQVRIVSGRVQVNTKALPPGTPTSPVLVSKGLP